jgi:hypothetical protein
MTVGKRLAAVLVGAFLLSLSAAGTAAALSLPGDPLLAADTSARGLSAYGDVLAWTREAEDGRRIVLRVGDVVRDAPIEPFDHPVLPDLGPGRDGSVQLVYYRCGGPRLCDLYRMPVDSIGAFTPLSALNLPGRSEYAPSTWNGRVAFGRAAALNPNGILPYGGATGLFASRLGRLSKALPAQTDLRGSVVAFAQGDFDSSRIATKRFGRRGRGRVCRLATAFDGSRGGGSRVSSVSLDGGFAYWLRDDIPPSDAGAPSLTTLVRRRPPDRRCRPRRTARVVRSMPQDAREVAVAGGRVFYVDSTGVRQAADATALFNR